MPGRRAERREGSDALSGPLQRRKARLISPPSDPGKLFVILGLSLDKTHGGRGECHEFENVQRLAGPPLECRLQRIEGEFEFVVVDVVIELANLVGAYPFRRFGQMGPSVAQVPLGALPRAEKLIGRHARSIAAYILRQSPSFSNAAAARSTVASSYRRPVSISPTGSPPSRPQGTLMPGWPLASNGQVLPIISRARATYSSRGQPGSGSFVATIGIVGMASRSYFASTSS